MYNYVNFCFSSVVPTSKTSCFVKSIDVPQSESTDARNTPLHSRLSLFEYVIWRLDSQINILLSSATWSKRINPNPHKSKENFRRRLMACRYAKWKRNTFFTVINHVIAFPVTWSIYNNTKLIFWKGDTAAAAADVSWVCFQKVWEGCIIVYVWNIATPFFTLAFFFLPEGILTWRGTLLFNIFF